MQNDVA